MQPILEAASVVGGQARLASLLGVTPANVNQWVKGQRPVPFDRCPAIERATAGAVTCEELAPGAPWRRIPDESWPYHAEGRPVLDHGSVLRGTSAKVEV